MPHDPSVATATAPRGAILITGPTRGLGLELFRLLAAHRWTLIAVGRQMARIAQLAAEAQCDVITVEADFVALHQDVPLRDFEARILGALEQAAAERVLFLNSAGMIDPIGRVGTVALSGLRDAMSVNFQAPAAITSACIRYARPRHAQVHVLNISSGAALRPLPGWGGYCASKAAIRHFLDVTVSEASVALSVEHLDPGVLDTQMQATIRSAAPEDFPQVARFVDLKDSGQLKSPLEVAQQIEQRVLQWLHAP